jgi:glycyl-tRNA synthetase
MPADTAFMEKLTALCKRRGFIFPSSEIYGGIGGFWDYGPLGVELKRNIKDAWWRDMVLNPPDGPDGREITMVGVDCALIMNPRVWEASGHVGGFSDPMVDCRETKARYRADQLFTIQPKYQDPAGDFFLNEQWAFFETEIARAKVKVDKHAKKRGLKVIEYGDPVPFVGLSPGEQMNTVIGPETENPGTLTQPRAFNLMFETYVGALQDASSKSYLRPETAQGIFVNFPNVLDTTRVKIPFGIAQIGKAFRNEINPRNYTFRSREFEQMEIEFFCRGTEARSHEGTKGEPSDTDWYEFWRNVRHAWYVNLGLKSEKLRLRDQTEDELAHYSKACADIEYRFPFSDEFQELEGVAHRGCYDLQQHQTHSGRDLTTSTTRPGSATPTSSSTTRTPPARPSRSLPTASCPR